MKEFLYYAIKNFAVTQIHPCVLNHLARVWPVSVPNGAMNEPSAILMFKYILGSSPIAVPSKDFFSNAVGLLGRRLRFDQFKGLVHLKNALSLARRRCSRFNRNFAPVMLRLAFGNALPAAINFAQLVSRLRTMSRNV